MFKRINFYSICFAFGLSVLLILAGSRFTDNTVYRPAFESRRNIRNNLQMERDDSQHVPSNPYVRTAQETLDSIREQIEIELENYNFSYSGVRQLEDLVLEEGGQPLRSVIISTWRSGTTFLGDILNAMPGNFYHYEPLLRYEIIQIRGPPHSKVAMSMIKKMLQCNFDNMEEYFEYGKEHMHQFTHNTRLWDHCRYNNKLCFDSEFTSNFCKVFPFQSMKVVRIRLRLVWDLLEDHELNFKVILMIRDPRAVMQSRQHRTFCPPSPDCWNPELMCADMISDYVAATRIQKKYPDRLMVLRYEDLALNVNSTVRELFKFLGLSLMPSVNDFLYSHTNKEVGGPSSTFRVSREVPFKWRNVLEFPYVEEIQTTCKEAMELWGYRMAHNASHMSSKDFNPLGDSTLKLGSDVVP